MGLTSNSPQCKKILIDCDVGNAVGVCVQAFWALPYVNSNIMSDATAHTCLWQVSGPPGSTWFGCILPAQQYATPP